ncbi:MAG: hypothetical protein ACJAVP_003002 [Spirosomataceae bacterium]|jgi:hypothetical protein
MSENTFIADSQLIKSDSLISGDEVMIGNRSYYKIVNYDQMGSFFMTLVSHADHWLFTTSYGGVTAGRKNSESSLFPYYTDDKLDDLRETTGSKTIIRLKNDEGDKVWEPFSQLFAGLYKTSRNLYKSVEGNELIFEEINESLGLKFSYSWAFSDKFGIVRKVTLTNLTDSVANVELIDGLQNIVPYGVTVSLQNERSNLVNAYKKSELEANTGLGMYVLSAIIVDKAEPSEALKATTIWASGIEPTGYLLSSRQVENFRLGKDTSPEQDVKAEPGAYFISASLELEANQMANWQMVAELNQDHADVVNLMHRLATDKTNLLKELDEDIAEGISKLLELVGAADGLQLTEDSLNCGRHYNNVLFNIMRGGIFDEGYTVNKVDFISYAVTLNKNIISQQDDFFQQLPAQLSYIDLLSKARLTNNETLIRITFEYLPLTFSRRHGDPSRPWNKFSIETRKADGSKNLNYQGNWRDIFQNWEALALSYPEFINSMIAKFVNASTIDGYNPYRITRNGIDWEVIEPDDPWSFIGYWGDHQIIYLLKLLEVSGSHSKAALDELLTQPYFVYANVPYTIKSYDEIVKDPKDTIDYDHARETVINERVKEVGVDGKMVFALETSLLKATLAEKLLVSLLAKLSNFIPEGGIWLNTQRPEWNDANNALVGNGVSMVTLYYIRRYLTYCTELFGNSRSILFELNKPVIELMTGIAEVLTANESLLSGKILDTDRKIIVDALGRAGETYRTKAYAAFAGEGTATTSKKELLDFFVLALKFVDHSVDANKREDGLYHAYNLVQFDRNSAKVEYLYEMLEGQVAVLSAGKLTAQETVGVLEALEKSKMFREDQYSYFLYPNKELPRFLDKNNIPASFIDQSELVKEMVADKNETLLTRDVTGGYHFNGSFTNAASLKEALQQLKNSKYAVLVDKETGSFLSVFEEMFNHRAFTGRSGTFFGYEGLGSIYWHMVSKLLLTVQENIYNAEANGDDKAIIGRLIDFYYSIRAGIGAHKSPELYGAFSTDPYSHTPAQKGAQQPGMTGQVKEDILNRWAELGVRVEEGKVSFKPAFLDKREFLNESGSFIYYAVDGTKQMIQLNAGQLAFTYCQVPIVYQKAQTNGIQISFTDGSKATITGNQLTPELSEQLFKRTGEVERIEVSIM